MAYDWTPVLSLMPEIVLTIVGVILPLGVFGRNRAVLAGVSAAALAVAALLALASLYTIPLLGWMPDAPTVAFGVMELTAFSVFFKLVFIGVAFLVIVGSPGYYAQRHQQEYYALLLFATIGMMVVAASRDLITLFVGFELASFSTYALAGYFKGAPDSNEAAVKYFIVGSISSALTLFGISLLYGITGSVAFTAPAGEPSLAAHAADLLGKMMPGADGAAPLLDRLPVVDIFAYFFILAGIGFKVALVPFHQWAPDTYDGAPSTVSAFLAAGSKKLGFVVLFKFFLVGLLALKTLPMGDWYGWQVYVALIAIITMTVGNVMALRQDNLKRMLAYSSVAHAGYMLIAIAAVSAAAPEASAYLVAGGLFHILTHAIMKSGAFLVVAAAATIGVSEMIDGWKGFGKRAPVMAFAMAIFMLSFAGLPPLAGFASKFVLFSGAIQTWRVTEDGWFLALVIAGILNSALSLFYYARVVRTMYVDDDAAPETAAARPRVPVSTQAAVVLCLVAVLVLGFWWSPAINLSLEAANALLAP